MRSRWIASAACNEREKGVAAVSCIPSPFNDCCSKAGSSNSSNNGNAGAAASAKNSRMYGFAFKSAAGAAAPVTGCGVLCCSISRKQHATEVANSVAAAAAALFPFTAALIIELHRDTELAPLPASLTAAVAAAVPPSAAAASSYLHHADSAQTASIAAS